MECKTFALQPPHQINLKPGAHQQEHSTGTQDTSKQNKMIYDVNSPLFRSFLSTSGGGHGPARWGEYIWKDTCSLRKCHMELVCVQCWNGSILHWMYCLGMLMMNGHLEGFLWRVLQRIEATEEEQVERKLGWMLFCGNVILAWCSILAHAPQLCYCGHST